MKFPDAHPAVVGTVTTRAGLRLLSRGTLPCDAIELRADALLAAGASVEEMEAALARRKRPVLLTLRIPAEGGRRTWKAAERRELFLRLLPLVDAIDVELAARRSMQAVIAAARGAERTVVLSAHALTEPATPAQLRRWTQALAAQPGAILKVAGQIKSWHDLQRLAGMIVNQPGQPVAVMGVGPHAAQSRAALVALGSRLVYGYLDQAAAPGQPSAAAVQKMVRAVGELRAG